jgi:hypothetical protein
LLDFEYLIRDVGADRIRDCLSRQGAGLQVKRDSAGNPCASGACAVHGDDIGDPEEWRKRSEPALL